MNKALLFLFCLCLFISCSSDEPPYIDTNQPEKEVNTGKYLFGYQFGASFEECNIYKGWGTVNNEWGYIGYPDSITGPSLRHFLFEDNKLIEIRNLYNNDSHFVGHDCSDRFLKDVEKLSPPTKIEVVQPNPFSEKYLVQDSLTWAHEGFKVLIRNGVRGGITISRVIVIEFKELKE